MTWAASVDALARVSIDEIAETDTQRIAREERDAELALLRDETKLREGLVLALSCADLDEMERLLRALVVVANRIAARAGAKGAGGLRSTLRAQREEWADAIEQVQLARERGKVAARVAEEHAA